MLSQDSSLKDWIISRRLQEIDFSGNKHTWINNRKGEELIMERLDRAYASLACFSLFSSTTLLHLPIIKSDHAPIIL